ncbi:MAG: caspase family protein [Candidatus Poribacteria bacterium]|nr:caspase family protein [Candidatus Poribacteria bacterium]
MCPLFRVTLSLTLICAAFNLSAETYAVIVGINEFRPVGVRRLQYAEDDARLMRDALIQYAGVREENIRLIVGEEATRASIGQAVAGWLRVSSSPGDTVVFYYAGHGMQLLDDNGDEEDGFDETILAVDSNLLDITFIRDDDLNRWLGHSAATRKIVILDCCHSGTASRAMANVTVRAADLDPYDVFIASLDAKDDAERQLVVTNRDADGTLVRLPVLVDAVTVPPSKTETLELSACRPDQVVVETSGLKHGAMTYYVAQGMQGDADADHSGHVTFGELRDYAKRHIRELGFDQEPQLYGDGIDLLSMVPVVGETTSSFVQTVAMRGTQSLSSSVVRPVVLNHPTIVNERALLEIPSLFYEVIADEQVPTRLVEVFRAQLASAVRSAPDILETQDSTRSDRVLLISSHSIAHDKYRVELANPFDGRILSVWNMRESDDFPTGLVDVLVTAHVVKLVAAIQPRTSASFVILEGPDYARAVDPVTVTVRSTRRGSLILLITAPDGTLTAIRPSSGEEGGVAGVRQSVVIPKGVLRLTALDRRGMGIVKAILLPEAQSFGSIGLPEPSQGNTVVLAGRTAILALKQVIERLNALPFNAWSVDALPMMIIDENVH